MGDERTKALILGAAGVLGSSLVDRLVEKGIDVRAMDICRIDEAWRLAENKPLIDYRWKASSDIAKPDLDGVNVVFDAGIGVADRPLGNASPEYTTIVNVMPAIRLLEAVRLLPKARRPTLIYPSSFNALYGHPYGSKYVPSMLPNPSSVYGWTKASVELLYSTYRRAYGLPTIICRVGSGYGPKMRSDELPARLILSVLSKKGMVVRSPDARRLWTYVGDIIDFYGRLVEHLDDYTGQTIHCAGNVGNETVTNMHLARMVMHLSRQSVVMKRGGYEAAELIDGKPISFEVGGDSPIWRPRHTLSQGLTKTLSWFKKNRWRYE
ncbi:MAG: NAD(P)-dependent oxidoreductase [Nitrososphaerota archaeon]|nr:NAD(P)-dependent oxidoreductase [Nitrososphaerota archaeon]